jgi:GTP-binding protein YchF
VKVGIVGMPNAGKSTLFSALTGVQAQAANYPFTTIDPNVAIVPVPDERLDALAAALGSTPITYETIEFHDIAGLVRGAHSGEGLGNRFLANIREVDAIVHVVRAHEDPNVVHPEGRVDPAADIDTIETELVFADLEQAERRLDRVVKQARSGDKAAIAEEAWLREVVGALQEGRWARTVPPPREAPDASRNLSPLTGKPVLYVVNVGEGDEDAIPAPVAAHAAATGAGVVAVSARIEAELSELDDEEAQAMREDLGAGESGLGRVIRAAFELLQLISFFTAGEAKEAKAYAIERGTTAHGAAG